MLPLGCMRALALAAALVPLLALPACGDGGDDDPEEAHVLDGADESAGDGKADGPAPPGTTIPLVLATAAVPGTVDRPNAVVYVPHGYRADQPVDVVVFLHGWWNCARNVLRPRGGTCGGGAVRTAYDLAGQLERSGKNAILLVPELAYERASSAPGRLAEPGVFAAMLDEALAALGPVVGGQGLGALGQVIVASHSGGYLAAAGLVRGGGVPVRELWLLDSLYGQAEAFDGWVRAEGAAPFAAAPRAQRLAVVYTAGGGTLDESQAMAARARAWVPAAARLDDRTGATLDDAALDRGLLFKRSWLSHDGVPRYYVGRLLQTSQLADR